MNWKQGNWLKAPLQFELLKQNGYMTYWFLQNCKWQKPQQRLSAGIIMLPKLLIIPVCSFRFHTNTQQPQTPDTITPDHSPIMMNNSNNSKIIWSIVAVFKYKAKTLCSLDLHRFFLFIYLFIACITFSLSICVPSILCLCTAHRLQIIVCMLISILFLHYFKSPGPPLHK